MSQRPVANGTVVTRTELTPKGIIEEIKSLMAILNTSFFTNEEEASKYGKTDTKKYSVRIEVRERKQQ